MGRQGRIFTSGLRAIAALMGINAAGMAGAANKPPRSRKVGSDRGNKKRALRAAANARVSEERPLHHMHSAARRRAQKGDAR